MRMHRAPKRSVAQIDAWRTARQHLGDRAGISMTGQQTNRSSNATRLWILSLSAGPSSPVDNWLFTEDSEGRQVTTAAIALTSRTSPRWPLGP